MRGAHHAFAGFQTKVWDDLLQHSPMHDVQLHIGKAAGTDLFHGGLIFIAPRVRECDPIDRNPQRLQDQLRLAGNTGPPVDEGAEHVEKERLDVLQWNRDAWMSTARSPAVSVPYARGFADSLGPHTLFQPDRAA